MIFVLIAGSYAPFCLISLKNSIGLPMLLIMFTIAIIGIIFKLCWFDCPRWLQTSMYIGMGWASIFMLKPLCANLPTMSIFWLVVGGVLYTIGGIIYGAKPIDLTQKVLVRVNKKYDVEKEKNKDKKDKPEKSAA